MIEDAKGADTIKAIIRVQIYINVNGTLRQRLKINVTKMQVSVVVFFFCNLSPYPGKFQGV